MTRRRPPTILDFFPRDEVDDRTWSIREHSQLRRQWRFIRKLPYIVQFLLFVGWLSFVTIGAFIMWLVLGALTMPAHADSIERQRNAEIAFCMDETNQRTSRAIKPALDRMHECLQVNGWLPGSGNPKVLPRDFVDRVNRAFEQRR